MHTPIRILIVVMALNRGGAETMIMNLYRKIDKSKVQFDFAVHYEEENDYENEAKSLGAKFYRFPRFTGANSIKYASAWNNFFDTHTEYKVIHGHLTSSATIYLKIAKAHGLYTMIHSHSAKFSTNHLSFLYWLYNYPTRYISDYFLGCSRQSGIKFFGKKVVNSERYITFPNAIDSKKFAYNADIAKKLRAEFGAENKTVLISVARFEPVKNHRFMLDIIEQLSKKSDEYMLFFVGDGTLKEETENSVHNRNLDKYVKFLGLRDDVCDLLSAGDIFLLPSLFEGLPCSVIEAVSTGLRCLISDNITDKVCISPLVERLPIDKGAALWADKISNYEKNERRSQTDTIKNAGYSIDDTSVWLQNFYIERHNDILRKGI